jgi:hypothetical protein
MKYRVKFTKLHNPGEANEYGDIRTFTFVPIEELKAILNHMFDAGYTLSFVVDQYEKEHL